MLRIGLPFLAAVLLLAGCAARPQYTGPVIEPSDPWQYWIQSSPGIDPRVVASGVSGCATIEITIDSNGAVADPKVLRYIGPNGFDSWLQKQLLLWRYRPSVHNPDRVPIRMKFNFAMGMDPKLYKDTIEDVKAAEAAKAASNDSCLDALPTQGIEPTATAGSH